MATGLKRIARTVKGQFEDRATVEPGRGSVYLQTGAEAEHLTIALSPDAADELARLLIAAAVESRTR